MIKVIEWAGYIYLCIVCVAIIREAINGKSSFIDEISIAIFSRGTLIIISLLLGFLAVFSLFLGLIIPNKIVEEIKGRIK